MEIIEVPCEIQCSQDGNQVMCLIGDNLQEGVVGFGDSLAQALRELADAIG